MPKGWQPQNRLGPHTSTSITPTPYSLNSLTTSSSHIRVTSRSYLHAKKKPLGQPNRLLPGNQAGHNLLESTTTKWILPLLHLWASQSHLSILPPAGTKPTTHGGQPTRHWNLIPFLNKAATLRCHHLEAIPQPTRLLLPHPINCQTIIY